MSRENGDLQFSAGAISQRILQTSAPDILVFDSGLGGLTVFREIAKALPHAQYRYIADDAVFPYGELAPHALMARVQDVLAPLVAARPPDIIVIACNTASTLVLPPLRASFPDIPIVGTVPAIKPAAGQSRSRMISVLATPGTVARDYTRELVQAFAEHCDVKLVGSRQLASLAEDFVRGKTIADAEIAAEIAPCFVIHENRRTDHVVIACTHYPLLIDAFRRLAPWPVEWIDPAPAIARQVERVLAAKGFASQTASKNPMPGVIILTSAVAPDATLNRFLAGFNLHTSV